SASLRAIAVGKAADIVRPDREDLTRTSGKIYTAPVGAGVGMLVEPWQPTIESGDIFPRASSGMACPLLKNGPVRAPSSEGGLTPMWNPWKVATIALSALVGTTLIATLVVATWSGRDATHKENSAGSRVESRGVPTQTAIADCNSVAAAQVGGRDKT